MNEGIPHHFEVIRSLPHGHVMAILETIKKLGLDKIMVLPNLHCRKFLKLPLCPAML